MLLDLFAWLLVPNQLDHWKWTDLCSEFVTPFYVDQWRYSRKLERMFSFSEVLITDYRRPLNMLNRLYRRPAESKCMPGPPRLNHCLVPLLRYFKLGLLAGCCPKGLLSGSQRGLASIPYLRRVTTWYRRLGDFLSFGACDFSPLSHLPTHASSRVFSDLSACRSTVQPHKPRLLPNDKDINIDV